MVSQVCVTLAKSLEICSHSVRRLCDLQYAAMGVPLSGSSDFMAVAETDGHP